MIWSGDAEPSEVYGTFRSAAKATSALVEWQQSQPGDELRAAVLPVQAVDAMPQPDPPAEVPAQPCPVVPPNARRLRRQPGPDRLQRSFRPPAGPLTYKPP